MKSRRLYGSEIPVVRRIKFIEWLVGCHLLGCSHERPPVEGYTYWVVERGCGGHNMFGCIVYRFVVSLVWSC